MLGYFFPSGVKSCRRTFPSTPYVRYASHENDTFADMLSVEDSNRKPRLDTEQLDNVFPSLFNVNLIELRLADIFRKVLLAEGGMIT